MYVNPEDWVLTLLFQILTYLCFNENEAVVETES